MSQRETPSVKRNTLNLIRKFTELDDKQVWMEVPVCGTAACIAGWYFLENASVRTKRNWQVFGDDYNQYDWEGVEGFASPALGLESGGDDEYYLFTPDGMETKRKTQRIRALAELTHLFNSGDIRDDWLTRKTPYKVEKLDPKMMKLACKALKKRTPKNGTTEKTKSKEAFA